MSDYRDSTDECPACDGSGFVTKGEAQTIKRLETKLKRLKVLAQAACDYIEQYPDFTVMYHDSECDGLCLIEDLQNEAELGEDADG